MGEISILTKIFTVFFNFLATVFDITNNTMNHYFMLCVIFGVTFALHTSGEKRLGNLPSEEFPINYLYDKINALEGQLKRLEEKDEEMKKMIEEKDDKMNILESRVTNLTSQLENFQGHSAMEPAFIVTAIWAN